MYIASHRIASYVHHINWYNGIKVLAGGEFSVFTFHSLTLFSS